MKFLKSAAIALSLLAVAAFTPAQAEEPAKAIGFGVVGIAAASHATGPTMGVYGIGMIVGCEIAYKSRGSAHPWCGDGKKMAAIDFEKSPHEAAAVPAMGAVNIAENRIAPVYPLSEFGKMLARINGVDTIAVAQKQ